MRHVTVTKKLIRVLIVDDSKVGRAAISKILYGAAPHVKIVGYAENGIRALEALDVCDPDIVILDMFMPSMDGITALPLILKKRPHIRIVVCSSFTRPGDEMSVKALLMGATVCIPKPSGTKNAKAISAFKTSLKRAVLGLYDVPPPPATVAPTKRKPASIWSFRPKIVAIGCSAGGPNALMTLLQETGALPVPVIITQHMMENFSTILARQLQQETKILCCEAEEGMLLKPAHVYLAPSGSHMLLKESGGQVRIHLDDGPAENFCKPSVDAMLRSAADVYGSDLMTVILTGMGRDGLAGCEKVFKAGGRIIAQDQESSVVWGMPGSVANLGFASAVLPLLDIARVIRSAFGETDISKGPQ